MRALCWHDKHDVRVESVPEPKILNPRDAIVRVSATAICGSDLHLYGGFVPGMVKGDILGHEFMGEVVDVGSAVQSLPTGYMAAENCAIEAGDTIAVWGCGPVGLLAIACALLLGAERVIAIDRFPERLRLAGLKLGADTIDYTEDNVLEALKELTGGRGPDACIDAVGMEAHAYHSMTYAYDRMKQAMMLESDRPVALREAIMACRSGGTISVAGVYGGWIDKFPVGALMNRSLTIRTGQTHVQRYMRPLLARIAKGEIDPSFVISHRMHLDQAPAAYRMFRDKQDDCIKVVLTP